MQSNAFHFKIGLWIKFWIIRPSFQTIIALANYSPLAHELEKLFFKNPESAKKKGTQKLIHFHILGTEVLYPKLGRPTWNFQEVPIKQRRLKINNALSKPASMEPLKTTYTHRSHRTKKINVGLSMGGKTGSGGCHLLPPSRFDPHPCPFFPLPFCSAGNLQMLIPGSHPTSMEEVQCQPPKRALQHVCSNHLLGSAQEASSGLDQDWALCDRSFRRVSAEGFRNWWKPIMCTGQWHNSVKWLTRRREARLKVQNLVTSIVGIRKQCGGGGENQQ